VLRDAAAEAVVRPDTAFQYRGTRRGLRVPGGTHAGTARQARQTPTSDDIHLSARGSGTLVRRVATRANRSAYPHVRRPSFATQTPVHWPGADMPERNNTPLDDAPDNG